MYMTTKDHRYYQNKLKAIQARHLRPAQRLLAFCIAVIFWCLLYLLGKKIHYLWVPFVVEIQKFSHLLNKYLTYFFAVLFIVVWFYLLYRIFNLALKFTLRAFSGLKEK